MSATVSRPVNASPQWAGDVGILLAAVVAISSSALLVRWADAPAVALAFWRTAGGALVLFGIDRMGRVGLGPRTGNGGRRRSPSATRLALGGTAGRRVRLIVAGSALALHFATWLASLELTSVAASVTLVSTAPLMIAVYLTVRGRPPGRATWAALVLAVIGTAVITGGDLSPDPIGSGAGSDLVPAGPLGITNALWGDLLALVGAAAMAVYLVVGAELRQELSTAEYTWRAYGIAAATLLALALAFRITITGFDSATWLAIVAMILGPQLIGHTGLNHLLERLGSLTVSLAVLTEPVAASFLVWLALGEVPPSTSFLGAPLVLGAVAVHLLASRNRRRETGRIPVGYG